MIWQRFTAHHVNDRVRHNRVTKTTCVASPQTPDEAATVASVPCRELREKAAIIANRCFKS